MEMSQEEVFAFVGRQALEIAKLRAQIARIQGHRCEPCAKPCCTDSDPETELLGQGRDPGG